MTVQISIIAAFFFSFSHIMNRRGLVTSNAMTGSLCSIGMTAIVLWVLVPFFVPLSSFWTPAIWYFVLGGIFAPGLGRMFNFISIEKVGLARTVPISGTSPMSASIMAVLLLGEIWTPQNILGTSLVILGVIVLSKKESTQSQWRKIDLVYPVMASFSFAASSNLRKLGLLVEDNPIMAAAVTATTAFIFVLGVMKAQGGSQAILLSRKSFCWFFVSGLSNTAAMLSVFFALNSGNVVIVEPLISVNPVITIFLSTIFLRDLEAITARVMLGAACTVVGSILVITV
ncbi:MAG: EamA family transporter [Deltaproteobacteria bacterium]|nr:EamA family transporter [Deltaproteobacteria bacterium]